MIRLAAIQMSILLASALPLAAQEGQQGIAFAYAPEQGAGTCLGGSPEKAMACARAKCAESGALPQDCARVAWCYPAGWSVAVGVMHKEGIHWAEYSCGWPSRESAVAAGKVRCDGQNPEWIRECVVSQLWDDKGAEHPVE